MDDTGLESSADVQRILDGSSESGAKSGALEDDYATMTAVSNRQPAEDEAITAPAVDPLLGSLLVAWARLSEEDRLGLTAMAVRLADAH